MPSPPRDIEEIETTPYPSTIFDDNQIHNVLALAALRTILDAVRKK